MSVVEIKIAGNGGVDNRKQGSRGQGVKGSRGQGFKGSRERRKGARVTLKAGTENGLRIDGLKD